MKPDIFQQLKDFSPSEMMENVDKITGLIRKIRLKQGGIGSEQDELSLTRIVMDLKFMVDVCDGLRFHCDELETTLREINARISTIIPAYEARLTALKAENESLKNGDGVQSQEIDL
jgi:hypothetical protein